MIREVYAFKVESLHKESKKSKILCTKTCGAQQGKFLEFAKEISKLNPISKNL